MYNLYRAYWIEKFKDFIQKSSDPMEWLYRLIYMDKNGNLSWNIKYARQIGGKYVDFKSLVNDTFGLSKDSLVDDLVSMTNTDNTVVLSDNFRHSHPFIQAAIEWHEKRKS